LRSNTKQSEKVAGAFGPRQFDHHRQRNPLQSEAFDGVFFTRVDWVSVAASLFDLSSAPAFNRVIAGKDKNVLRGNDKDQNDQSEQDPCSVNRVPFRSIEHPMVVLKVLIVAQTDDSQAGCDSALAALKQHAEQQHFCVFPSRLGKQGLKNYNQTQQIGRQCLHMEDSFGKRFLPERTRSADIFSKTKISETKIG
jgi:hypothetical protein